MDDQLNELMLALFRAPESVEPERLDRLSAADWDEIVRRAGDQRCLPYLAYALEQAGHPTDLAPVLQARRDWQLHYLLIARECCLVHQLLNRHGIPHLFLKGIALALGSYPQPGLRPVRDIDLLVRPEDLARAHALLLEQGGPIARYAHKDEEFDPAAKHCIPIWSPSKVIAIELHDKVIGGMGVFSERTVAAFAETTWAEAASFEVGGNTLPCPGPTMMFLHLVIHALYDHELNNGPLFVTDLIHLLQGSTLDPEAVARRGAELGITTGIALALSLLPPDLPQRAELSKAIGTAATLPEETVAALMFQDTQLLGLTKLAANLSQRSWRARAGMLLGKLFADRQTMLDRWVMAGKLSVTPPSGPLLWLWYLKDRATAMRRLQADRPDSQALQHLLVLRRIRDAERM